MQTFDIDLAKLTAKLENVERYRELSRRLTLVISAASAHEDLRSGLEAMKLLRAYLTGNEGPALSEDGIVGGALFSHAIILYCRATETRTRDRLKWFGRDMLQNEMRDWHADVMHYRDHVLAHFGRGNELQEGPTIKLALILQIPSEPASEIAVTYIENRANTRSALSNKLEALLTETVKLAQRSFHERLKDSEAILFTSLRGDPQLRELAAMCRHDDSLQQPGFDNGETGPSHYRIGKFGQS